MIVVTFLLSALLGEWHAFTMTTPLRDSDREAILADAYGFGASYEEALGNRRFAYAHRCDQSRLDELRTWNSATMMWRWEREIEWRYRCWDALEDALNPTAALNWRLLRLNSLRLLLGDEAYRDRWMPAPTPTYRVEMKP